MTQNVIQVRVTANLSFLIGWNCLNYSKLGGILLFLPYRWLPDPFGPETPTRISLKTAFHEL